MHPGVKGSAQVADLKPGMWFKLTDAGQNGIAKEFTAGQFLVEDGNKISIFRGLPPEFLVTDIKDWYTNIAGGLRFKIQLMRQRNECDGLKLASGRIQRA